MSTTRKSHKAALELVKSREGQVPRLHDTVLRENIEQTRLHTLKQRLSDDSRQYALSKLLCHVERTETGNAIRFAVRYGHLFHYVPEPDKWYVWNGKRWEVDTGFSIMAHAKTVAAYIEMEAESLPPPLDSQGNPLMRPQIALLESPTAEQKFILAQFDARDKQVAELRKWAIVSRAKLKLQATIELLKSEPGVTVAKACFDTDDYLLNCRNGVYDLKTGELLAHSSERLMSRVSNAELLSGAMCPQWQAFVKKVMRGREGLEQFLQKIAGMGLCGRRFDDVFVVFHGDGSNGKTVYQEVLRDILGDYADLAPSEMFLEKKSDAGYNDIAGLDGIRLLFKDETKQGRRLDEGTVKELTGGGGKKARFLFKEFFTFIPKFTPVLSTNHRPIIAGNDNGIWRRVKLVPWEHNFDKDPEKRSKDEVFAAFKEEYPGILLWAWEGLRMALEDLERHGSLQIPAEVVGATEEYREQSDVIGAFLAECCVIESDMWVSKGALYKRYRDYMEEAGSHPLNKPNFGEDLKKRGFDSGKTGTRGHYWLGLRLRDSSDDNDLIPDIPVSPPSSNGHKPAYTPNVYEEVF